MTSCDSSSREVLMNALCYKMRTPYMWQYSLNKSCRMMNFHEGGSYSCAVDYCAPFAAEALRQYSENHVNALQYQESCRGCEQCAQLLAAPDTSPTEAEPNTSLELVISACESSLDWLLPIAQNNKYAISIYSKCSRDYDEMRLPGVTIEQLRNVGRCDHTYAYHIWKNYNTLKSTVVFMKDTSSDAYGSRFARVLTTDLKRLSAASEFTCQREPDYFTRSVWHNRRELWKFRLSDYTSNTRSKLEYSTANSSMYAFLKGVLSTIEFEALKARDYVPVCYGGAFSASSQRIHSVSRTTWMNIVHKLSGFESGEAGHYMERSWRALLSTRQPAENPSVKVSYVRQGEYLLSDSNIGAVLDCTCCCHEPRESPKSLLVAQRASDEVRRVLIFTHSLNSDGAPKYVWKVAMILLEKYPSADFVIISPSDGAMRCLFEHYGMKVAIHDKLNIFSSESPNHHIMNTTSTDLLVWNTILWLPYISLYSRWVRDSSRTLWIIHEYEIVPQRRNEFWYGHIFPQLQNLKYVHALFSTIDAVVMVSEAQLSALNLKFYDNIHVLRGVVFNYPAGLCFNGTTDTDLPHKQGEIFITAVGTVCSRKRQHWLVAALRALNDTLPESIANVHVDIIGDIGGEYSDQLKKRSAAFPSVHIRPFMPTGRVRSFLARSHLHVSTSSIEAYPLNTLEALSMGVPVLATNAGGTAEQPVDYIVPRYNYKRFEKVFISLVHALAQNRSIVVDRQHDASRGRLASQATFRKQVLSIIDAIHRSRREIQEANMYTL